MLDLTKAPASERRSMGVPGGSGGGLSDGTPLSMPRQQYDLPVKLKTEMMHPPGKSGRMVLSILIVNIGSIVLKIPSCLDEYAAFPPGALNRRSLNFGLVFENPVTGASFSDFVEVTSGSDSVSNCLIPLNPGDSLMVVMSAELPKRMAERGVGEKSQTLVHAFIEEWKFDESRYVIEQQSKRVESEVIWAKK